MKLRDYQRAYGEFSGKSSEIGRSLSFAGFALIWILRGQGDGTVRFDDSLLVAGILFAASLGCDLAQYLVGTLVWGIRQNKIYKKLKKDKDRIGVFRREANFYHTPRAKVPQLVCFVLKFVFLFAGYMGLFYYVYCTFWA